MNREELEKRVAAISNEMERTKANYAKLEGHLNESKHWLQEIISKEEKLSAQTSEQNDNITENESGQINDQSKEQAA